VNGTGGRAHVSGRQIASRRSRAGPQRGEYTGGSWNSGDRRRHTWVKDSETLRRDRIAVDMSYPMLVRNSSIPMKSVRLRLLLLLAIAGCVAGCTSTGGQEPAETATTSDALSQAAGASGTPGSDTRVPCEDGRLLIADLPHADDQWEAGLREANARAAAWHEDSRLVEFRVSCGLFEPGFRWQATYFSAEAQALFAADTRESSPIDVDPEALPTLDLSGVSFAQLREVLLSVDYADDNELEPSTGVDIRVNSTGLPFGPPEAPIGSTIAHVSIEHRGEIKDLFITTETSEIFQFSSPSG
jgi:hypothetical protein